MHTKLVTFQLCMRLCLHVFSSLGSSETFNSSQCFSTNSPPVQHSLVDEFGYLLGGGPGVVVSTAAFHARVRGSFPGLGVLEETKMFPSTCETQYCGEPM